MFGRIAKYYRINMLGLVLLAIWSLSAGSAQARARQNAILIIDSSISMSGKIGKTSKISRVRKAISPALKTFRPRLNLGVMFYGHRRRGDCTDIQHVIRTGRIRQKRYMEIINGVAPAGRAPIVNAVAQAAKLLKKHRQSKSIILMTDGLDVCTGDPCALGKKLERENSGLKVHVIAVRSSKSKLNGLRCLAKRTGGEFIASTSQKKLREAVNSTFKIASRGPDVPLPRMDPRRSTGSEDGENNIAAVLKDIAQKEETRTTKSSASTVTTADDKTKTAMAAPSSDSTTPDPEPKTDKPVEALNETPVLNQKPIISELINEKPSLEESDQADGPKQAPSAPIEIAEAPTLSLKIPEKAELQAELKPSAPGSISSALDTLFRNDEIKQPEAKLPVVETAKIEAPEKAEMEKLAEPKTQADEKPAPLSPPEVVVEEPVAPVKVVAPVDPKTVLKFDARLGSVGAKIEEGLAWRLFAKGKQVKETTQANGAFTLSPGTYELRVQYGILSHKQSIVLEADKPEDITISFDAGFADVSALKAQGGDILDEDVAYRLFSSDKTAAGKREKIADITATQHRFIVKPGRYQLIGTLGSTTLNREFDVTAGEATPVALVFNTGILNVSAIAGKGGEAINGTRFVISRRGATTDNPSASVTANTAEKNATFTLPAGEYQISAEFGLTKVTRTVSVKANKSTAVIMSLNMGRLQLSASPAAGAQLIKDNVSYRIFRYTNSLEGTREQIAQISKSTPTLWLPAGEYYITANSGLATASARVKVVTNDSVKHTIVLHTGSLRLSSKVDGLPTELKSLISYVVYDSQIDAQGNRRKVMDVAQATSTQRVPPGEYIIEGRWGNTNATQTVSAIVAAGKQTSAIIVHKAGRAKFDLTTVPGGVPRGERSWRFYDFSGTEVGRNSDAKPERVLAAGRYVVIVAHENQEFRAEFSIRSGDEKQIDIVVKQ